MNNTNPLQFAPLFERSRAFLLGLEAPVFLVGGAVRDALLGRVSHDVDLVVAHDAVALAYRLGDHLGLPAYRLDEERDIGRVVVPGTDVTIDVARFRGADLAADLYDRDFTVNALALPLAADKPDHVIDLHHGLADLRASKLRIIHRASVLNDPVRALRAARFAAQLGFSLTSETAAAAREGGQLIPQAISPERVRDELTRILATEQPDVGVSMLHELDLLSVVLPEVAALDGLVQSPPHHEPVLEHTLSVLRYLPTVTEAAHGISEDPTEPWYQDLQDLLAPFRAGLTAHMEQLVDGGMNSRRLLSWGALLHDIGKAETQTVEPDGRIRFLGHDEIGAAAAARRLSRLAFSNEAVMYVRQIVAGHMRPLYLANDPKPPSRRAIFRFFKSFPAAGLDIPLLALADHLATYNGVGDGTTWQQLLGVVRSLYDAYFNAYTEQVSPQKFVGGRQLIELLGIEPGPEVGRLLRLLEEAQAAGEVTSPDEALAFVRRHA